MIIKRVASAGSLESNDAMITVCSGHEGRQIHLKSAVDLQFHDAIMGTINEVLDEYCVDDIELTVVDNGALDFVLRARLETALQRAKEE